jgi:hypothetical protein
MPIMEADLGPPAAYTVVVTRPVAQPADLWWGHEARAQHLPLGDLGQPHRVELVGLGPAR